MKRFFISYVLLCITHWLDPVHNNSISLTPAQGFSFRRKMAATYSNAIDF